MINKLQKIIVLSTIVFSVFILWNSKVDAAFVTIVPSNESFSIDEEFYVDIKIDTEGLDINGVSGSIEFNNEILKLVRIEEGKSLINLWIEKPIIENNNTIIFSGIIPNGFEGVIDPFDSGNKHPGILMRIILKGQNAGQGSITAMPLFVTLNDGLGTTVETSKIDKSITILNTRKPFIYKDNSAINPELYFEIIKDKNIYNNKYVLIFNATDKKSGIEKVMIKEGRSEWVLATSPYLLKDQSRHRDISILATNYSGVTIVKNIEGLPYKIFTPFNIVLLIVIIIILLIFVRKIYVRKFNK